MGFETYLAHLQKILLPATYDLIWSLALLVGFVLVLLVGYLVYDISRRLHISPGWLWALASGLVPVVLIVWLVVVRGKITGTRRS